MLKKLLLFQVGGILLIWILATWQWWETTSRSPRVTAHHRPYADRGEANETESDQDTYAGDEVVSSLPTILPTAVTPAESMPELRFPVAGYDAKAVISVFGDKRGKTRTHEGVDIKAPRHTPVVAVVDGYVEKIREGGSGGKQLYLRAGDGRLYYYAHLEDWSVEEYAAVREGQQLGTVGDSGNAKGTTPHLHFEVQLGKGKESIDPLPLLITVP